jgi:3',5'-cyclic AMP phosphodiesterase CpdA
MLIAQITDTHVSAPGVLTCGGTVDTATRLAETIATINALKPRPDCLVVSGDLADQGRPEEYPRFAEVIATSEIPVILAIGNHDDRAVMADHLDLPAPLSGGWVQYTVDDHPVRIVVLDSTSLEHHMAEFCDERLAWLEARLAEQPDRDTVIVVHHPPFDTGIALLDGEGAGWADGLLAAVADHAGTRLILSGHVHRPIQTVVAGVPASVCPSTAQQTTIDLAPSPSSDSLFVLEPPAFQLHSVPSDGPVVTHTVPVGDFPGIINVSAEARAGWADRDPREIYARRDHHSPSA